MIIRMNDDLTLLTSSLLVVPVAATAAGIAVAARDTRFEYVAVDAVYAAAGTHKLHTADDHCLHLRLYILLFHIADNNLHDNI